MAHSNDNKVITLDNGNNVSSNVSGTGIHEPIPSTISSATTLQPIHGMPSEANPVLVQVDQFHNQGQFHIQSREHVNLGEQHHQQERFHAREPNPHAQ